MSGRGMATGGTPPVNTLTKAGPAATPFTGDIDTYGEGPEHDFFPASGGNAPPAAPSGGGNNSGGNSNASGSGSGANGAGAPFTGTGASTPSPGIAAIAQSLGKTPTQLMQTAYAGQPANRIATGDTTIPYSQINAQPAAPAATPQYLQNARTELGLQPQAAAPAPAAPAPIQAAPAAPAQNPLNAYLKGLGGYQTPVMPRYQATGSGSPRNMATGGSSSSDSAEAAVTAPQQNVKNMEQRGEQPAGSPGQGNFTGRDFADANVAASPSLKSSIGIGSMIAGLAFGGPMLGALGALTKLGSFNVPGPTLSTDVQNSVANQMDAAQNVTPGGRVMTGYGAVSAALAGERAAAMNAANNPGPAPVGGYSENPQTHELGANFTSPGFNGGSGGGGGNGVDASHGIGGGYGNTATAGGVSRGSSFGGSGPDAAEGDGGGGPGPGGGYKRGGRPMRFPGLKMSKKMADGGSSDDDSDSQPAPDYAAADAQQTAQRNQQAAQPTTGEYITDPGAAYMAMKLATMNQAPSGQNFNISVPKKPPAMPAYDEGGPVVSDPSSVDTSDPSYDATAASSMNGGGIGSNWLPLLAGAYSAAQDPASAAASIGVATAMTGGTQQQAMDSAKLMARSGANQIPQAQTQQTDPSRTSTNQLLAQLAAQTGLADKLALAAQGQGNTMSAPVQPYQKPLPRTRIPMAAATQSPTGSTASSIPGVDMLPQDELVPLGKAGGGQMHQGPGPVAGEGDGQSDHIPAMLSDGEYVVDAGTVSALGNGSNKAGAQHLDNLRAAVRQKAGWNNPKKIQPNLNIGGMIKKMAGGRA
jgi:hypothetical protein